MTAERARVALSLIVIALLSGTSRAEAEHPTRGPLVAGVTPAAGASSAITLKSVTLRLERGRVVVEQILVNQTAKAVAEEVQTVSPLARYDPVSDSWYEITGLAVRVNGVLLPVQPVYSAQDANALPANDVTGRLKAVGIDVSTFGGIHQIFKVNAQGGRTPLWSRSGIAKLSDATRRDLQKLQLLSDDPEPLPLWFMRATFSWVQDFPPGVPVRVRLEYVPPTEGDDGDVAEYAKEACVDSSDLRKGSDFSVFWYSFDFLSLARWKGPAERLELEIVPSAGLTGTCWDSGHFTRTASGVSAKVDAFTPRRNLTVFFFSAVR